MLRKEGHCMAKKEALSVKVDYLSLVFDTIKAEELITNILKLSPEIFLKSSGGIKHKDYTSTYYLGEIKIVGDVEPNEKNLFGVGCYLMLGGRGCDELLQILHTQGKDFSDLFRDCNEYVGESNYHLTRIDLAIDDRNEKPYFTIEQIKKKCEKYEFISRCSKFDFDESSFIGSTTAKTVYIGKKGSDISFRFYDKDKEVCMKKNIPYDEMKSWKRTEIQLRGKMAHNTAMLLVEGNPLGDITFGILKQYLRFVVKDTSNENRSKWETCDFWNRFIGAVEPLKLETVNKDTDMKDTQKWLEDKGIVSIVKGFYFLQENNALDDLKTVQSMIYKAKYSIDFSNKLVSHLYQLDRKELIPLVYKDTKGSTTE